MSRAAAVGALGALGLALAACLPAYTVAEGSTGTGGATGTTTSAGGTAGQGGGACADPSCDPHGCGAPGHDCLGGACFAGVCQPVVLADHLLGDGGLVVTATDVYWTSSFTGTLGACPTSATALGSAVELSTDEGVPRGLVRSETHLYWPDMGSGTGRVRRCALPLCAGGIETVHEDPRQVLSLALDATFLYAGLGAAGSAGGIARCPLAGCAGGAESLAEVPWAVEALAPTAAHLFWVDAGQSLHRCPLAGCSGPPDDGKGSVMPILAQDEAHLYVADRSAKGGLYRCPLAGCGPLGADAELLVDTEQRVHGIAVDATHVYWTEQGSDGTVWRAAKDGTGATLLAAGQGSPGAIALSADAVYWQNAGNIGGTEYDGSIVRVAK